MSGDINEIIEQLKSLQLCTADQIESLGADPASQYREPTEFLNELVNRGWLTRFQADRIAEGKANDLVINQYVVLDQLGEGGMGLVYKCRHTFKKRTEVLKVIRQELKDVDKILKRFMREIEAASRLNHENIVTAYDAGAHGELAYFAMEYVEGTDLGQLVLRNGAMPVRDACDCIRQAALGLEHAHQAGLIHRDIKPDNLLLAKKNKVVKLLDLGLCRLTEQPGEKAQTALTVRGTALGTPEYMAPEQIRDSATVDIRADIYSLGCTFYYLLAGKDAFAARTPTEVMFKQIKEAPPPIDQIRPSIAPAVVEVLYKMMEKKPEDRYQTPQEVADALAKLLESPDSLERPRSGGGTMPTPPGPNTPRGQSQVTNRSTSASPSGSNATNTGSASNPTWILVAVGAVILVVGGLVIFFLTRS